MKNVISYIINRLQEIFPIKVRKLLPIVHRRIRYKPIVNKAVLVNPEALDLRN